MKILYECEYCNFDSYDIDILAEHETLCKKRSEQMKRFISIYKNNFEFEEIVSHINNYLKEMYNDYFERITLVNYKFREKVNTSEKFNGKYNDTFPSGNYLPGYTGQIYGSISENGKTLADYPELGFKLDHLFLSNTGKSWNSGFRFILDGYRHLSHIEAKYLLTKSIKSKA